MGLQLWFFDYLRMAVIVFIKGIELSHQNFFSVKLVEAFSGASKSANNGKQKGKRRMKNGLFETNIGLIIMCEVIDEWNRSLPSGIFDDFSILNEKPVNAAKIRIIDVDFMMKVMNKLRPREYIRALLKRTIDSSLPNKLRYLSVSVCKQLCENQKIRIDFPRLSDQISSHRNRCAVEIVHPEPIELSCHFPDILDHVVPSRGGVSWFVPVSDS